MSWTSVTERDPIASTGIPLCLHRAQGHLAIPCPKGTGRVDVSRSQWIIGICRSAEAAGRFQGELPWSSWENYGGNESASSSPAQEKEEACLRIQQKDPREQHPNLTGLGTVFDS